MDVRHYARFFGVHAREYVSVWYRTYYRGVSGLEDDRQHTTKDRQGTFFVSCFTRRLEYLLPLRAGVFFIFCCDKSHAGRPTGPPFFIQQNSTVSTYEQDGLEWTDSRVFFETYYFITRSHTAGVISFEFKFLLGRLTIQITWVKEAILHKKLNKGATRKIGERDKIFVLSDS